ncbi:hypothetical protein AAIG11_10865 [Anoxynatronum sibiricum]|uniref:Uncharacterized protein n=1 Tax=Anoxynatronum sibiricum TaxID=210623 RepID=A0ABU9VUY2_9CLOT
MIDLWEPESNPEDYEAFHHQGITLFIPKKLTAQSSEVVISLSQLFKWKKLMLEKY